MHSGPHYARKLKVFELWMTFQKHQNTSLQTFKLSGKVTFQDQSHTVSKTAPGQTSKRQGRRSSGPVLCCFLLLGKCDQGGNLPCTTKLYMKGLKQPIKRNIMEQDRRSEWNTLGTHSKERLQELVYQADYCKQQYKWTMVSTNEAP